MKVSQVSTQSMFQSLRQSVSDLQRQMADAQSEVTTGKVADPSLLLGERNGRRVSLTADVERLSTIKQTNALALSRLKTTLASTTSINEITQSLLSSLTATIGNDATAMVTAQAGRTALSSITDVLNTTVKGEYIFGGINSDETVLSDFETGGGKAALDAAFLSHFGFAKTDPAAKSIDSASITAFLDTVVAPMFEGAGWATHFSSASDDVINARINVNENAEASVSANEDGIRNAVFAAVITSQFLDGSLGSAAQGTVAQHAISLVGKASGEIADLQGRVGFLSNRIDQSTARLSLQIDELTAQADEMVAVDPYEAATRLNSLITQIETSYTLTGRMQQLSLMRFL